MVVWYFARANFHHFLNCLKKMTRTSKLVKNDSKIIISLHLSKSVIYSPAILYHSNFLIHTSLLYGCLYVRISVIITKKMQFLVSSTSLKFRYFILRILCRHLRFGSSCAINWKYQSFHWRRKTKRNKVLKQFIWKRQVNRYFS